MNRLDRFFEISARSSTIAAEIRGGVVTFIAMAYIIVLNPIILSSAEDVDGNRLEFAQVSATTSLAAGVMTIVFGVVARLPFAFAAGLGINSFLATTVVGSLTWPEAMGLVVINGLIIVLLAATGLRRLIFDAVPMQLKLADHGRYRTVHSLHRSRRRRVHRLHRATITARRAGHRRHRFDQHRPDGRLRVHAAGERHPRRPAGARRHPHRTRGRHSGRGRHRGDLASRPAVERPGGWSLSVPTLSGSPFALPDLSLVGEVSVDSFGRIGALAATMLVFTLVFANFFDAMGTFTGLSREAGLADSQGTFPRLPSALIVEGAGAVVGGATSASSNTVFIESGAGIEEGARTGFANLVTGVLFLAAMFIAPLASIVPTEVAAAALVIVGAMMASHLRHIDISEFSVALPVVLTVVVMPFSYSIANGIGVGFIAWVVLRSATGKAREISPLLWIVAAGFLVYFARGWIESLNGM